MYVRKQSGKNLERLIKAERGGIINEKIFNA
jgi:hypothetical protein